MEDNLNTYQLINADVIEGLNLLPDESVDCCVTSPPYWGLRDYGVEGQLGLEGTINEYILEMVDVFYQVRRVLKKEGTLWINIGDSYTSGNRTHRRDPDSKNLPALQNFNRRETPLGLKPKDLCGIPWELAFALRNDGWYLRSDIIWAKPNPMPESVTDRPTKSHEYLFLFAKSQRYYFDQENVKEPWSEYERARRLREKENGLDTVYQISSDGKNGQTPQGQKGAIRNVKRRGELAEGNGRNIRTVWTIPTQPFPEAHFATYPEKLVEPCIKAGCPENGIVLDPFSGSGTTGVVSLKLQRNYIGIELNPSYLEMSRRRIGKVNPMFCKEMSNA
jgi:DNA modification methylase